MMEGTLIDMLFGVVVILGGWVLKRIFFLLDRLQQEDKIIHGRLTELATDAVSRQELQGAIDRVLQRIDKMEERLMSK